MFRDAYAWGWNFELVILKEGLDWDMFATSFVPTHDLWDMYGTLHPLMQPAGSLASSQNRTFMEALEWPSSSWHCAAGNWALI